MTIQELELHHKQRPFEPFRLLVADGRSYDVRHPERLASLRSGRMVSVATDEGFVILDLLTPGRLGELMTDEKDDPAIWVAVAVQLAVGVIVAASIT